MVTGGPSAGKTSVLEELERRGYRVQYEAARIYIDEQMALGKTIEEIRKEEAPFQRKILEMKIEAEKLLPADEIIFFDRGIPDSIAYYELAGLSPSDPFLLKAVKESHYRKVFLPDLLPMEHDYARTDADKAGLIHQLLEKYYTDEGYSVIRVPKMTIEERADVIVENLYKRKKKT